MEPNRMLWTAAILFGIGALGGLLMAALRLRGMDRPPAFMAVAHGLLGGAALTLLIYAEFTLGIGPLAQFALAVLLVAALLGLWINLRFHANQLALPISAVVVHALVAVAGFGVLVAVVLQLRG